MTAVEWTLAAVAVAEAAVFALFGFDKAQARAHGQRIRERTLLRAVLVGGIGAWFAQHLLRHKTRKEPFRTRLGLALAAHLIGVGAVIVVVLKTA